MVDADYLRQFRNEEVERQLLKIDSSRFQEAARKYHQKTPKENIGKWKKFNFADIQSLFDEVREQARKELKLTLVVSDCAIRLGESREMPPYVGACYCPRPEPTILIQEKRFGGS